MSLPNRKGGLGIFLGDASTWLDDAKAAGLQYGTVANGAQPEPGAIAVWVTYDHVAFVENNNTTSVGMPYVTECNNVPKVGYPVVIANDSANGLHLRTDPTIPAAPANNIETTLPQFTIMQVIGGPVGPDGSGPAGSYDGYQWYQLQGNGYTGWAAWLQINSDTPADNTPGDPTYAMWDYTRIQTNAAPHFGPHLPDAYIYLSSQPSGPSFTYSLPAGLDFISFPFTPSRNGSSLLSDVLGPVVNNLVPEAAFLTAQGFQILPLSQITCQAKVGYVLLVTHSCQVSVSGTATDPGVVLQPAWNLVGVTAGVKPAVDQTKIYPTAFTYSESTGLSTVSLATDGLQPGIAYFVLSWGNGNVLVPAGTQPALAAVAPHIRADDGGPHAPRQGATPVGTDFAAKVTVSQQGVAKDKTLSFGMNSAATDGYDSGVDQVVDIPFPGALEASLDALYSVDIKSPSSDKDWQMLVRSQSMNIGDTTFNANPVQISWAIPATGSIDPDARFQLLDSSGKVVVADMLKQSSISYTPAKAADERDYVIHAAVQPPPPATYTVTASAGAGGSINPSGQITVSAGGSQLFTATPDQGFAVDQWFLDGTVVQSATSAFTLSNVQADHAVSVTFRSVPVAALPVPTTTDPTAVGTTNATLNGAVNPNGPDAASAFFEYGTDPALANAAATAATNVGAGENGVAVSGVVTNLLPGTQYYCRLVATNSSGATNGAIVKFSSLAIPTGSWTAVLSGGATNYLGVCFLNPGEGWVVGSYGAILHTKDGGATWEAQTGPTDWQYYEYYSVYFADPQNGWACGSGNGGIIIHTSDGGKTWAKQFLGGSGANIFLPYITGLGTNHLWAASSLGLFFSTDDGATWQTNTAMGSLTKVHFLTPKVGYAVPSQTPFLATRDGGRTWTPLGGQAGMAVGDLAAVGGRLWGVGDQIFYSADGGATWTEPWQNAGASFLRCVKFVNAEDGWAFGDSGTILQTVDGGVSWSSEGISLQGNLWDASFVDGGAWAVGDGGSVLKYAGPVVTAPRTPFGENPQFERGRGFSLSIGVEPGRNYDIQASSDMGTWLDLTNLTATGSSLGFTDHAATNLPTRFYRAVAH